MKQVEEMTVGALAPGMIVAEAVVDDGGRLLIPAGAELSENTIASLLRREVQTVKVEREVPEDPAETEAYRAALQERMDHLFRHAGNASPTRALYQAIFDHRMEHRS